MSALFIKAETAITRKTDTGYTNYLTTVTTDRPLFREGDGNWDAGSQNRRLQDAIETLLLEKTGAIGQMMGTCADRYPTPNAEGFYVYKFETYCDASG